MITRSCCRAVVYATLALSAALLLDILPTSAQAQSLVASEAATQSAQAKLAAATLAQNAGKKKYPVTREDIVVAMPVDQAHLTVAHASRVWRKVKTLLTSFDWISAIPYSPLVCPSSQCCWDQFWVGEGEAEGEEGGGWSSVLLPWMMQPLCILHCMMSMHDLLIGLHQLMFASFYF